MACAALRMRLGNPMCSVIVREITKHRHCSACGGCHCPTCETYQIWVSGVTNNCHNRFVVVGSDLHQKLLNGWVYDGFFIHPPSGHRPPNPTPKPPPPPASAARKARAEKLRALLAHNSGAFANEKRIAAAILREMT